MIKGEIQISEAALKLPPIQLRKNAENIPEEKFDNSIIEELNAGNLSVKIHFARLKRRIRCRSSNIL